MAIPFTVVSGAVLITDTTGKTVDMVDSNGIRMKTQAKIIGADGALEADVINENGQKRLATTVSLTSGSSGIPTLNNNLVYDDMNVSNGGIARGTTIGNVWTQVYDHVGGNGGIFLGFLLTLEKLEEEDPSESWAIRLIIDGVEIFSSDGILISDIQDKDVYGFDRDESDYIPEGFGFIVRNRTLRWEAPNDLPISYNSNIQVLIKKISDSKKFRAGLAVLTKE